MLSSTPRCIVNTSRDPGEEAPFQQTLIYLSNTAICVPQPDGILLVHACCLTLCISLVSIDTMATGNT